ncbi:MAG: pilus assembly protein PilM [Parcubacteria group bacterium]|nr:pilus assembly protein PilM [Parcubacteria group bacterium]
MAEPSFAYEGASLLERGRALLFDFLENVFRKGSTSVVGIDVGSSSIKVVQLKKRAGKGVLETYGELALGPYGKTDIGQATNLPAETLGTALGDIVREANVTAIKGGMAIPLSASLLSIIEIPFVPDGKLDEMVPIEARRYIPVPISEVTLDWRVVPSYGEETPETPFAESVRAAPAAQTAGTPREKAQVLIAAIHNETIATYQRIAAGSGVAVDFLEIEAFSLIRALAGRARATMLILDIGAATTKVVISENGIPVRSHIINRGSQDITQAISKSLGVSILKAEEQKRQLSFGAAAPEITDSVRVAQLILRGIFTEANRMLLSYEQRYNRAVSSVILAGGGALIPGLVDLAADNFDVSVELADPFAKVETPAFMAETLREAGPNFSVAAGIALRKLQELE